MIRLVFFVSAMICCTMIASAQQTATTSTESKTQTNPCDTKEEFGNSTQVRMPVYLLTIGNSPNTAPGNPYQYSITMAGSEGSASNVTFASGLLSASDRQTLQSLLPGHVFGFQPNPQDRFAILKLQPILYTKDAVDKEISKARKEMICALQDEVTKAAVSDAVVKPVDDRIKALEEQVQKLAAEVETLKTKIK